MTTVVGKFKTGRLDDNSDAISADVLYDLLLQSDHDKVVDTEVMSNEVLEALLDREICKKPASAEGDVQDTPSQNDEANKNFFKVLDESDSSGKDLQGITGESTNSELVANTMSSS